MMAGKSLDQLNLKPAPVAQDPRDSEWYRFSQEIDDLLATGRVTFAESTLRGIQESVERTEQVTEGQRRAVRNIEAASERSRERPRGGSRRYEGWR
jgi:hypothetical protein